MLMNAAAAPSLRLKGPAPRSRQSPAPPGGCSELTHAPPGESTRGPWLRRPEGRHFLSVPRRPRGGGGMQAGAQSGALCRPPGNGPRLPPDRSYVDSARQALFHGQGWGPGAAAAARPADAWGGLCTVVEGRWGRMAVEEGEWEGSG